MLDKISQLLFVKNDEAKQPDRAKSGLSREPTKSSHAHSSNAVGSFLSSIKGVGHPEYPILDSQYSPSSRVPCTDLVPFISERIIEGDINNIKLVMRAVIEGNPGLGIGPGWIDESVENILSIPFENYVAFPSAKALPELKALFIVAAKDGGGREFLITEEIPRLISWACIAHQPSWSTNLHSLSKKANSWIAKMAKDTLYWKEYERFNVREVPNTSIETELRASIITLTPAARLQLFYAVERGGGSFATYRKSWKKDKLVGALDETGSTALETIAKSKNLVLPNFQLYPELRNVVSIADEHQVGFKLLCFA